MALSKHPGTPRKPSCDAASGPSMPYRHSRNVISFEFVDHARCQQGRRTWSDVGAQSQAGTVTDQIENVGPLERMEAPLVPMCNVWNPLFLLHHSLSCWPAASSGRCPSTSIRFGRVEKSEKVSKIFGVRSKVDDEPKRHRCLLRASQNCPPAAGSPSERRH
jgi:hypothetical protein